MNVAIVRGGNLNEWDSVLFVEMAKHEDITLIGSKKPRCDLLRIPTKKILLFRFGILTEWAGYLSVLQNYVVNVNDYLFGLKKTLKDFDVVETADPTYPFTYQAVKSHRKVIVFCYQNIPFFQQFGLTKKYIEATHKHAAHFIACTEQAKSVLILEGVPEHKITVMTPGIDTALFKPKPKDEELLRKHHIKETDINILFTGRVFYDKGIDDLVLAFKRLTETHSNVNLLIVGRGPMKKRIESLVAHYKLEKQVKFLGFLPYRETERYYNLADIFCVPSKITKYWQEQFGFVFAEALCCGKPIVSTHAGSIPEVTGGNALLVSPGNHHELYKALDKLVSDPILRKEMAEKARAYALQTYDVKVVAQKRLEIYRKVVSQR